MITTKQVKDLRDKTGISIMQCKKALEEAKGDVDKALLILQKKGAEIAGKKSGRSLGAGVVASYIHNTKQIGTLVELACETDFVAKNEEFSQVAYDIAMQVAASSPEFIKEEDISDDERKKVQDLFKEEVDKSDKPKEIKEKMLAGKVDAYFKEKILLDQPLVKDPDKTINDLIHAATQKFGERVEIVRFVRYAVGVE